MIKINLLPNQEKVKKDKGKRELGIFILLLFIFGFGICNHHWKTQTKIERLKQVKKEKKEIKLNLQKKTKKIRNLKSEIANLKSRIKIIKKIRKVQTLPIQYLNELVVHLTPKTIWFNSLQLESDGTIQLKGIALDNQIFAQYISGLRDSNLIKDVILKRTSRQKVTGLKLISFQCNIKI